VRPHDQHLAESSPAPAEAPRHPNTVTMNPVPSDSLGPLLEALQRSGRSLDLSKIQRAYEFATRAHASQKRASGEPYVTHAVSVAVILAELLGAGADETLLQASLLH